MARALRTSAALLLVLSGIAAANPFERPGDAQPRTEIDKLVFAQLDKLEIQPARLCSDAVFLRRAYLDIIGALPTAQQARTFLQDKNPDKRALLIDDLLARPEFADYWAMKWCDLLRVKAEFPINLWPNAVQAYHHWIRDAIRRNMPYDRFARELLTANGSNFRVPQVNFYRAVQSKTPRGLAQAVALTFMGQRADKWDQARLAGMAAFFSQIDFRATGEWKEEIVVFDPGKPMAADPNGPPVKPIFPDGAAADIPQDADPREAFARWLITPDNPWFTRNIANRLWSWLLGRGIIHEPDDIRPDNPPTNPELLALLEKELIAADYDLKSLYRFILNSTTYQLSCVPRSDKPEAAAHFAYYPMRQLEAEVLIDALNQITGTTEKYSSEIPEPYTFIPESQRAIDLADGSITSSFLEMFGRPSRDTGLESERTGRPTASQRLHMLNSSHIQRKIERSPALQTLARARSNTQQAINGVYLTILSRFPTEDELEAVNEYTRLQKNNNRTVAIDLVWSLINSPEFLCRH
ncbi:MAG TPA: DUF1553 domain-containing protein [Phycisphaerales bacterium]|nr:DUF1553 domain-containing protein [Phycisphaerales bacterium]